MPIQWIKDVDAALRQANGAGQAGTAGFQRRADVRPPALGWMPRRTPTNA